MYANDVFFQHYCISKQLFQYCFGFCVILLRESTDFSDEFSRGRKTRTIWAQVLISFLWLCIPSPLPHVLCSKQNIRRYNLPDCHKALTLETPSIECYLNIYSKRHFISNDVFLFIKQQVLNTFIISPRLCYPSPTCTTCYKIHLKFIISFTLRMDNLQSKKMTFRLQ